MIRVDVRPELLRWALDRSGIGGASLTRRFPKLDAWERGEARPTFKQLEEFAGATHTPFGYFFLPAPPVERVPIPDFRTIRNEQIAQPSANLLEMLYTCQQRQEWYRDFARLVGEPPVPFVGSVTTAARPEEVAGDMRAALGFDLAKRKACPTWEEALRQFITQTDEAGVMVMCSGVVLNNTHRPLDPDEFRGFALADPLAPLVFVNGADTKSAQMFTLAHELAHLWLGQSALSDAGPAARPDHAVERWCNQVAAELLVPLEILRADLRPEVDLWAEVKRLAGRFKVSTLVILRRLLDVGRLSWPAFAAAYDKELQRLLALPRGSGGNFYLTLGARASKRFSRALVISTIEGHTSFTEALRLLGFRKMATFREVGQQLGVAW
ncbi:MAG TPA: ImmA/IrrE family metallo-endopeptidase [Thermoanaerobaculaceae bacterium]|nr:ImmA/IrrE family metallo-endopeptidase [Thermoanaerobaculaceae bacterium]